MFKNKRYITNAIKENLPIIVQVRLWTLIDTINVEVDYLQVFELVPTSKGLEIIHTQEVPKFSETVTIDLKYIPDFKPFPCKIFIIDDGYHSTMMFSKEY